MKDGYKYYKRNMIGESLIIWLETWNLVKDLITEYKITSIISFDNTFDLNQYLYNWVLDFQEVLQNSHNHKLSINFCEWLIQLYDEGESNIGVIKTAIAEANFCLGNKEKGESCFQDLTAEKPEDAWWWINWSRQYWFSVNKTKDYVKGELILLEALKEGGFQENVPYEFDGFDDLSQSEKGRKKIGRNDPCPCGSGKKYKKCCLI